MVGTSGAAADLLELAIPIARSLPAFTMGRTDDAWPRIMEMCPPKSYDALRFRAEEADALGYSRLE